VIFFFPFRQPFPAESPAIGVDQFAKHCTTCVAQICSPVQGKSAKAGLTTEPIAAEQEAKKNSNPYREGREDHEVLRTFL
jgi:hypothetical protein